MDLKAHVDAIESANNSDDEQHHHDQHHLKKVGMTLRSIMAAFVRLNLPI
jgi:hypothetical protein